MQGIELNQKPWLEIQLHSEHAEVRHAAATALYDEFNAREMQQVFLEMLKTESDDDVLITLMSAVSTWSAGTKDVSVIAAIRGVRDRCDEVFPPFQEAIEDALLRVACGLNTKSIIELQDEDRRRLLSAIR